MTDFKASGVAINHHQALLAIVFKDQLLFAEKAVEGDQLSSAPLSSAETAFQCKNRSLGHWSPELLFPLQRLLFSAKTGA